MWDLSSQATDATGTLCVRRQSPNQWTTREVPVGFLYKILRRSHNKKKNEKERKEELRTSKRKKGEETRVLSWVISRLFPSSSLTIMLSCSQFQEPLLFLSAILSGKHPYISPEKVTGEISFPSSEECWRTEEEIGGFMWAGSKEIWGPEL